MPIPRPEPLVRSTTGPKFVPLLVLARKNIRLVVKETFCCQTIYTSLPTAATCSFAAFPVVELVILTTGPKLLPLLWLALKRMLALPDVLFNHTASTSLPTVAVRGSLEHGARHDERFSLRLWKPPSRHLPSAFVTLMTLFVWVAYRQPSGPTVAKSPRVPPGIGMSVTPGAGLSG